MLEKGTAVPDDLWVCEISLRFLVSKALVVVGAPVASAALELVTPRVAHERVAENVASSFRGADVLDDVPLAALCKRAVAPVRV